MNFKRLLCMLLCLCMFASIFSVGAFAEEVHDEYEPVSFDEFVQPPQEEIAPLPAAPAVDEYAALPKAEGDEESKPVETEAPKLSMMMAPKAANDISASLNKTEGVYDGTNQLPGIILTVTDKDGNTLTKDTDYTVARADDMSNAGSYPITVTGIGSYSGTVSLSYTISPAAIPVTALAASKTFGESEPEAYAYSVAPEFAAMLTGALSREAGENAGTYAITQGTLASNNANYAVSFSGAEFTINAKPVSIALAEAAPASYGYTGSAVVPTVNVYLDAGKTQLLPASEYELSCSNNVDVTDSASAVVSDKAGGNYSFSNTLSVTFAISKGIPVYTAPSPITGLKYSGASQQLINLGTVSTPNCQIQYSRSQTGSYSTSIPYGTKAGTYEIWWQLVSSNPNFESIAPQKLTVTIAPYSPGQQVTDMILGLNWLPGMQVDPGNAWQRQQVLNAWVAYQNLSYAEQQKVPAELYNWLYYLVGNTDYAIVNGNGGIWYKGKSGGISFTAIDTKGKFAGIRVDGQLVDSSNYTYYWYGDNAYGNNDLVVVNLKSSYLTDLSFGQHSIEICYWNGYAPGHFNIMEATGSPPTGDTANLPLWGSLMLASAIAMLSAVELMRRRKKSEE